jgi:hypothetical protein
MNLPMECSKCRVSATCPRNGSSPALTRAGKKVLCNIIGGYGRTPVDVEILSAESLGRSRRDGPCMTIAEVPVLEDDSIVMTVTTIFSPPVLHERESTNDMQNRIVPRAFKQE